MNANLKLFIQIKEIPKKKQKLFGLICADKMFKDYEAFCLLESACIAADYLRKCNAVWTSIDIDSYQTWEFDDAIIPDADDFECNEVSLACNAALCLRCVCTVPKCAFICAQYYNANADLKDYLNECEQYTTEWLNNITVAVNVVRSITSMQDFFLKAEKLDLATLKL